MAYYVVKDFARGLDARRLWETTEVGALIDAVNVHVTDGGEIEVRKGFIKQRALAPGTHGLWVDDDNAITVFGSIERPAGLQAEVTYIRCRHPDGSTAMNRVLCQDSFFGRPYIVAEFIDGTVHHFYDGARIVEEGIPADYFPETPPEPEEPEPEPPKYPIGNGRPTATMSLYYSSGGDVTEIRRVGIARTGTRQGRFGQDIEVTYEYYDIADRANFPLTVDSQDVAAAVQKVADWINEYTGGTIKCHASASFNQLTVSVDDYDPRFNSWILKIKATKNIASDPPDRVATFSGGTAVPLPEIPPGVVVPPGGITAPPEEFRWSPGRFAVAHRGKMYATSGTLVHHSAIDNCVLWSPDATGAGFIDVTTHSKGRQDLVGLGEYQNLLSLVARKQIQLWAMDPDPRRNQLMQTIHNTGTISARSITEYGSGELFYLDLTGIRALSARTVENVAYMRDVGSLIDPLVRKQLLEVGADMASKAIGLVEPLDGRLWMIVAGRIYVLSHFPSSKISAWTLYEPGFTVDYADVTATHAWLRSGNDVYCYGGLTGIEFEESVSAAAQLPYLDFQRPATAKLWQSIDAAIEGSWRVQVAMDPTRPEALATVGQLDRSTYGLGRIAMFGESTHISLRFTFKGSGPARLGAAVLHYTETEAG
jgi:hypothetical protein